MPWQHSCNGMCKILKQHDTLQWSYTAKKKHPSNLNYEGNIVRKMGARYDLPQYIHGSRKIPLSLISYLHNFFRFWPENIIQRFCQTLGIVSAFQVLICFYFLDKIHRIPQNKDSIQICRFHVLESFPPNFIFHADNVWPILICELH